MLTRQVIRKAVEAALEEDAPNGDITCATTIPPQARGEVRLVARERGVMSGIDVFVAAFKAQNPETVVMQAIADGDRFDLLRLGGLRTCPDLFHAAVPCRRQDKDHCALHPERDDRAV